MVGFLDADVLLRIVDDLVSNAVTFSPEGSPVLVRRPRRTAWFGWTWSITAPDCRTGMGCLPASPGARIPQDRGGLGLGLHVVRALADAHAGRVEVGGARAVGQPCRSGWPPPGRSRSGSDRRRWAAALGPRSASARGHGTELRTHGVGGCRRSGSVGGWRGCGGDRGQARGPRCGG